MNFIRTSILIMVFFAVSGGNAGLSRAETVILVDKSKYELHLANYNGGFEILKTIPVTIGKNSGDKLVEGDQKTPEGIYLFTQRYVRPQIKKKFGAMAFYIDFPNAIDRQQGKTGFDIMLHSTDDPARLERHQDSDGCIVVNDERIKELDSFIQPQKTKVIIFDQLKPEFLRPTSNDEVKNAFEKWLKAWSGKDLENYIGMYAEGFTFNGMNRAQYKEYKGQLNKKYHTIQVTPSNVQYFSHPKYSLVTFTQEYQSAFKDGRVAFKATSTKRLYFTRENGSLKITSEGN